MANQPSADHRLVLYADPLCLMDGDGNLYSSIHSASGEVLFAHPAHGPPRHAQGYLQPLGGFMPVGEHGAGFPCNDSVTHDGPLRPSDLDTAATLHNDDRSGGLTSSLLNCKNCDSTMVDLPSAFDSATTNTEERNAWFSHDGHVPVLPIASPSFGSSSVPLQDSHSVGAVQQHNSSIPHRLEEAPQLSSPLPSGVMHDLSDDFARLNWMALELAEDLLSI